MEEKIKELSLLLFYLNSIEEETPFGKNIIGYKCAPNSLLKEMEESEHIRLRSSWEAKSVVLTEKGLEEAKKLAVKYLK